jgi:hypothetical protein
MVSARLIAVIDGETVTGNSLSLKKSKKMSEPYWR